MKTHPRAGLKAIESDLIDCKKLENAYYNKKPLEDKKDTYVSFGTSGHRGSSLKSSFNELHIFAITLAIIDFRKKNEINGPIFVGMDTHFLSKLAMQSVLQVLSFHGIKTLTSEKEFVPTPALSFAILKHNKMNSQENLSDGIIITPSHNPPEDGGIKYNFTHGGPSEESITKFIENRANEILFSGLVNFNEFRNQSYSKSDSISEYDFLTPYVCDLSNVINFEKIKASNLKIAVDPMGGAGLKYWQKISDFYDLNLNIINKKIDPQFSFMTLDKDGAIRMDCSSEYAMNSLLEHCEDYDLLLGNDPDFDRHGVATKAGLMKPNHFLSVCIDYLFKTRKEWNKISQNVGKTLVSSLMVDRVAKSNKLSVYEVPVGFKWFVKGLLNHEIGFAGEESAGASFLRLDGKTWTTDKDGIILCLLAAEIMAVESISPQTYYDSLEKKLGKSYYTRIHLTANKKQKDKLLNFLESNFKHKFLAEEKITQVLTCAPGNNERIGGLKIETDNGWFVARPSGTEDFLKVYCESFISEDHLQKIIKEAEKIIYEIMH